jgi:hypothetical protein
MNSINYPMSRFTDLFQPKPEPVVEEKKVDVNPDKVVDIGKRKKGKNNK